MRINTGVVIAFTLTALSGCGEDQYELARVTGTLTCNGKPVERGVIWFTPQEWEGSGRPKGFEGKGARGALQPDGTFEMTTYEPGDGALIGPHRIRFDPPQQLDRDDLDVPPEERAQLLKENPPFRIDCSLQLNMGEFEVQAGDNHLELTLTP